MTYQAVLFDLDGTLLDTLDDLADSMNAVLAANGLPTHAPEAYKHFVGDGIVNLARRTVPPGTDGGETFIQRLVRRLREEYARRWNLKTRPYPGVGELLDALEDKGIGKAVLSNKPQDFTGKCVSSLLGDWRFDAVVGVSEHVPPKPDATGVRKVVDAMGLTPEQFVYLGDTNTDMTTASAAGMYPVGALWGFRTREELLGNGARLVIDHPSELLRLF